MHDPGVLADLPDSREVVLLEQLDSRAGEKPALRVPVGGRSSSSHPPINLVQLLGTLVLPTIPR